MEQVYDVAVIGAGPSGVAAAVYAAKYGAKTVLLEKESMIGGTAFRADVHTLKTASFSNMDGLLNGITTKAWDSIIFHPETLVDRYYELLNKYSVTILSRHEVISVNREKSRISSLVCATATGKSVISAKVFIDASGTLEVENLTGESDSGVAQYCYMTGLIGKVETVGGKCYSSEAKKLLKEKLQHSIEKGEVSRGLSIEIQPTVRADIAFMSVRYDYNGTIDGLFMRNKMNEAVSFMQEFGYGFENASLISSSKEIFCSALGSFGAKYTLSLDDIIEGKYFNDQIAKLPYGQKEYYIPYSSLLSERFNNLVLCGKNIGAATNAISEINSIPTHFETGKAAGAAAGISVTNDMDLEEVSTYEINTKTKWDNSLKPYIPTPAPSEDVSFDKADDVIIESKMDSEEPEGFISPKVNAAEKDYNENSFKELDKFLSLLDNDVAPPTRTEEKIEEFENDIDLIMNLDSASIIKKEEADEDDLDSLMDKVGEFSDIGKETESSPDENNDKSETESDLILELFEDIYKNKQDEKTTAFAAFIQEDDAPETEEKESIGLADEEASIYTDAEEVFIKEPPEDSGEPIPIADFIENTGEFYAESEEVSYDYIGEKEENEAESPEQEEAQKNLNEIEDVFEGLDEYTDIVNKDDNEDASALSYSDANEFMSELYAETYDKSKDIDEPLHSTEPADDKPLEADVEEALKEDTETKISDEMPEEDFDEDEESEEPYENNFLTYNDIKPMESAGIITSDDVISMLYSNPASDSEAAAESRPSKTRHSSDKSKKSTAKQQKKNPPQRKKSKEDKISSMLDMIYDITEQEEGVDQLDIIKNKETSLDESKNTDQIKNYDKFRAIKDFLYNNEES